MGWNWARSVILWRLRKLSEISRAREADNPVRNGRNGWKTTAARRRPNLGVLVQWAKVGDGRGARVASRALQLFGGILKGYRSGDHPRSQTVRALPGRCWRGTMQAGGLSPREGRCIQMILRISEGERAGQRSGIGKGKVARLWCVHWRVEADRRISGSTPTLCSLSVATVRPTAAAAGVTALKHCRCCHSQQAIALLIRDPQGPLGLGIRGTQPPTPDFHVSSMGSPTAQPSHVVVADVLRWPRAINACCIREHMPLQLTAPISPPAAPCTASNVKRSPAQRYQHRALSNVQVVTQLATSDWP